MLTKPYPKDNQPRLLGLPPDLIDQLADHVADHQLGPDDLLFATRDGTPVSRNAFRTRIWLPAIKKSGVDFDVRVHDLRHAHASWLLAGGSDLTAVVGRLGHAQITTTQNISTPTPTPTTRTSPPSTASAATASSLPKTQPRSCTTSSRTPGTRDGPPPDRTALNRPRAPELRGG